MKDKWRGREEGGGKEGDEVMNRRVEKIMVIEDSKDGNICDERKTKEEVLYSAQRGWMGR